MKRRRSLFPISSHGNVCSCIHLSALQRNGWFLTAESFKCAQKQSRWVFQEHRSTFYPPDQLAASNQPTGWRLASIAKYPDPLLINATTSTPACSVSSFGVSKVTMSAISTEQRGALRGQRFLDNTATPQDPTHNHAISNPRAMAPSSGSDVSFCAAPVSNPVWDPMVSERVRAF